MSGSDPTPPTNARTAPSGRSRLIAREPVLAANLLAALVLAVCVLLRAFGVPLTDGQQNAINGVVGVLATIGAAIVARRFTTSLVVPRNSLGESLVARGQSNGRTPPNDGPPTAG